MITLKNTCLALAGFCALMLTSLVFAENLANPATGGANQVTKWCSDGTNTFTTGCTDSLSQLLLGPSPNYPDPIPSSPGGNVELGFPPTAFDTTNPTTLSGNFAAGDTLTLSSLVQSDWTPAFCEQWVTDALTGNGVPLPPPPNDVAFICGQLIAGYDNAPYFLQRVSNPNISYATKTGGTVTVGTATVFNAALALKQILPPNAPVPDLVQFSEPVKISYEGTTRIDYCAGIGSITATNQYAEDAACDP